MSLRTIETAKYTSDDLDNLLDETHEDVVICGISFSASRILEELNPIAYSCALNDIQEYKTTYVCPVCGDEYEDEDDALDCCLDDCIPRYLETVVFTESDDENGIYCVDDLVLSDESVESMKDDIRGFLNEAGELIENLDISQVMHDFWLTRNRHGAGFWDGDYEKELGEKLTKIAHSFGETSLYIGDDGLVYFS